MKKFFVLLLKTCISLIAIISICFGFFLLYEFLFKFDETSRQNNLSQILGGLLSGILTVIGVGFTIIYQNNARKEDTINADNRQRERFRLENLPLFQYNYDNSAPSNLADRHLIGIENDNSIDLPIKLIIQNIGLRPAQHIYFEGIIDNCTYYDHRNKNGNVLIEPEKKYEHFFTFVMNPTLSHKFEIKIYYDDLVGNHYMQHLALSLLKFVQANMDTEYKLNISSIKDYKIIVDNVYRTPGETISGIDEFDKLAGIFLSNNDDKIYGYAKNRYKKIKFSGGNGDPIEYKQIKENICDITSEYKFIIDINQYISYIWVLRVDLERQKVTVLKKKITHNSLPVSPLRKWINNLLFKMIKIKPQKTL